MALHNNGHVKNRSKNSTWRVSAVSCTVCTVSTRPTTVDELDLGHLQSKDCWNLSLRRHKDVQTKELHQQRRQPRPAPPPCTIREPTLGLPGAAQDRCNKTVCRSVQGSGVRGCVVTLPKEVTLDGQVLGAAAQLGVLPTIGLVSLHLQTPG